MSYDKNIELEDLAWPFLIERAQSSQRILKAFWRLYQKYTKSCMIFMKKPPPGHSCRGLCFCAPITLGLIDLTKKLT